MYELWIRDGARVERVTTAADKGTLRRMWRVHRDAAITLRGEVLEFKTGCSDKARAPIASAARQAFREEPSPPAPLPPPEVEEHEQEEPEDDDDLEATEECHADGELGAGDNPEADEPAPAPEPSPAKETAPTTAPSSAPTEPAPAASPRELVPGTSLPCGVKDCRCTARVPRLGTAAFACMPDFCETHRTRARAASLQCGISVEAAAALLRLHGRVTRALARTLARETQPTPAAPAPVAPAVPAANDRTPPAPVPAPSPTAPSPATVAEHAPPAAPAVSPAPAPSTAPTIHTTVTVTVPVQVEVPAEYLAARELVDRFGGTDALARLLEGLDRTDLARLVSFAREFRRAA